MSDPSTPQLHDPSETSPASTTITEATQSVTLKRSYLVSLLSVGLIVCFPLPWMRVLFFSLSGFDIQKEGELSLLLWAMPALAAIACIAGLAGKHYQIPGQLAGVTPFLILFYGLYQYKSDLLQVLEPSAWIALALGLALIISSRR